MVFDGNFDGDFDACALVSVAAAHVNGDRSADVRGVRGQVLDGSGERRVSVRRKVAANPAPEAIVPVPGTRHVADDEVPNVHSASA